MAMTVSKELIDYYAPLTAVEPGGNISVFSYGDDLGMMSLGGDHNLYLFSNNGGDGSKTAPFQRTLLESNVDSFTALRLKGTNRYIFAYIRQYDVYMCDTTAPQTLTKNAFHQVNLSVKGCESCTPASLRVTGMDGKAYLLVSMKDRSGHIKRIMVDGNTPSLYPVPANFSKIHCEVAGRSVRQTEDGVYTLGEYGSSVQLLYTPLPLDGMPAAPRRFLLPVAGDLLSVCPLKNQIGTHLFVAGGGGIAYYPLDMQYDCEHGDHPDPVVIVSGDPHIAKITAMSSFISDGKIYVYVLSETGQIYYAFAQYDEASDEAGDFSELLLLQEGALYFKATGGRLFICEKNRLIYGVRDPESGDFHFKKVHFDASTGEFTKFKGVQTKITTAQPETELMIYASNPVSAYINGRYSCFTQTAVKSDQTGQLDIVQYAEGLTVEPFTVQEGSVRTYIDPSDAYHDRLRTLSTPDGLKNARIYSPGGHSEPLLPAGTDDETVRNAAAVVSTLMSQPALQAIPPNLFAANVGPVHTPCYAQCSNVDITGVELTADGSSNGLLHFLADVFNSLYKFTKEAVKFVTNVVKGAVEFVIQVGGKVFKFILDTAWKILEAVAKVLSYIGIPLDKLLDFLKYVFDADAVLKERDTLKQIVLSGFQGWRAGMTQAKTEADMVLAKAAENVADWAGIQIPGEIDKKRDFPEQQTIHSMYLFDLIWRRFDLASLLDVSVEVKPSNALVQSAARFYQIIHAENVDSLQKTTMDAIIPWISNLQHSIKASDIAASMKTVAGIFAVSTIQLTRRIADALFDFSLALLDFVLDVMEKKIHIPILSDILNLLGIPDFSLSDLILLPAAFFCHAMRYSDRNAVCFSNEKVQRDVQKRLPDQNTRNNVCYIQSASFVVECIETIYTAATSLSKQMDRWTEDHCCVSAFIPSVLTAFDFALSYVSGYYYSPMSKDAFWAVQAYGILWYAKTGISLIISLAGFTIPVVPLVNKKFGTSYQPNGLSKLIKCVFDICLMIASVTSFVFECIALGCAIAKDCPKEDDPTDFKQDKSLFLTQTAGYLVDDARNFIDGAMDIVAAFEKENAALSVSEDKRKAAGVDWKLVVYGIRAGLSTVFALDQLAYGIMIGAF